jgi:hypothetical protein
LLKAAEYIEPLEPDELQFLQRMEVKDREMYYKVYNVLMVMSFIIPFIGSWYRAFEGAPNAFSFTKFYASAGALLTISTAAMYGSYRFNLRKVQWDIRHKTKTIEVCHITRKQYMPHNNAFYFYIDSVSKLSIEVSELYFRHLDAGDEVSLEFTTHARMYLGYF